MKTNIFRIALMSMAACVLFAACSKEDANILRKTSVTLSGDSYFSGNTATVTATLANPIDKDVTINLVPGTQVSDSKKYTIVDGSDLSFSTITIPAGQTSATGTVTVNTSNYEKGRYQAQVCVGTVNGSAISASADKVNITLLNGVPLATLTVSDFSYEGEGTVTVNLDTPTEAGGTITLKVASDSDVPESAMTFEKVITIEADKTSGSTDVVIDLNKLTASGPLNVAFDIDEINGEFESAGEASGEMEFVLPVKNADWSVEYYGPYETATATYQAYIISGSEGYFDLYRKPKGSVEEDNTLSAFFLDDRDDLARYLGRYTIDDLLYLGDGDYLMRDQDPGDYDIWMIGFDENLEPTGEYTVTTYTVEKIEADENYTRWLGDWTIGNDEDAVTITISQNTLNKSYYIDGLEGVDTEEYEISAVAYYDETTGGFNISAQEFGQWEHSSYGTATDVLYGQIMMNDKLYLVSGDYVITDVIMNADGSASMTAGSVELGDDENGYTLYTLVGMKYYWLVSVGAGGYSNGNTALPNTLYKVEAEEEVEESVNTSAVREIRRFRSSSSVNKNFSNTTLSIEEIVL